MQGQIILPATRVETSGCQRKRLDPAGDIAVEHDMSFSADAEPERQNLEVAVELRSGADRELVVRWLEQRDLTTLPLVVGLLAKGHNDAVREAFGVEPNGQLPVPEQLAEHVVSIYVVPPKVLYDTSSF